MQSSTSEDGAADAVLGHEAVSMRGTTWQSVLHEILHRIRTQRYPAGSLIPTEVQLASELGCARATVNRAMTELAQRGVVIRRRKVGTRVAEHAADALRPMSDTMRERVEQSGRAYRYDMLSYRETTALDDVARHLMVPPGSPVMESQATIWADDLRWAHEQCWLRAAVAEPIPDRAMQTTGPYEWVLANMDLDRVETVVSAAAAQDVGSTQAMQQAPEAPLLVFSTVLWVGPDPIGYVTHSMDSAFHLQRQL